jgi:Phosphoribosylanthranilate isomerase
MIVKVCGMCDPDNIRDIANAGADWIGMIFYDKSPRYVGNASDVLKDEIVAYNKELKKVGVFVNATFEDIIETRRAYRLDYIQLHGNEEPELCDALKKQGVNVIKALSIASEEDVKAADAYVGHVDFLLFDTKCEGYGGSGKQFDWSVLDAYTGETPFILSGGLKPDSAMPVKAFSHHRMAGVDINSGFEISPALKNVDSVAGFIKNIKS